MMSLLAFQLLLHPHTNHEAYTYTRTCVDTVHYRIITQSTYPISLLLFWPLLLRLETQDLLVLKVSDVPPYASDPDLGFLH